MSRSQYKQKNEVPIATEIVIRNIHKSRKYQQRAHKKPTTSTQKGPHKGAHKTKRKLYYPPQGGWKGEV